MNNNSRKIFKISLFLIGFVVIFSCGINSSFATTSSNIYVSTHGNDSWDGLSSTYVHGITGPKATIKNAVGTVNTKGTVYIVRGTYNESNIQINSNMNIIGENQKNTIINGQQSKNSIFTIASGVKVTISNLTFTNNSVSSYYCGAIHNIGNLTVYNSTFTNNIAYNYGYSNGGAISNEAGTLIVYYCTFTNNSIFNDQGMCFGGAIYNEAGKLLVYKSTFINNSASDINDAGGALYNKYGTLTVDKCIFINNTSKNGGAIGNEMGTLIVYNSTFINNTASNYGGAICNYETATVNFNRFIGNKAGESSTIYSLVDMDAKYNWFGSNANPSSNVNNKVDVTPWMVLTITANSNTLPNNYNSTIIVDMLHDSKGVFHDPANGQIPGGMHVTFCTTLGTVDPLSIIDVTVQNILNSGSKAGLATVSATLDNQTVQVLITILDTISPTSSANLKNGTYNTTKSVSLTMSEPGTIYYTTNGTKPTYNSNRYINPINITKTTTLRYFAVDLAGNISPIYTQTYTINKTAPKVATTTPTNRKTGVSRTSTISIKFSENIKNSTYYNSIKVRNLTTGKYVTITKSISGNTLSIKTSEKSANTWYTVTIPRAAIKDNTGNNLTANYTFKFKTGK